VVGDAYKPNIPPLPPGGEITVNVLPPAGFASAECSIIASFQDTYDGAVGGIDRMCVQSYPNGNGWSVRCLYSGGGSGSAGDCAFIIGDGGNLPCHASYMMMCAK